MRTTLNFIVWISLVFFPVREAWTAPQTEVLEWIQLEQYRNGTKIPRTSNSRATVNQAKPEYQPGNQPEGFAIPAFRIPPEKCTLFEDGTAHPWVRNKIIRSDGVWFPVHPQLLEHAQPEIQELLPDEPAQGIATASTRTVFVIDDEAPIPVCLKLHFPFEISRWKRHLPIRKIRHSIALSRYLKDVLEQTHFFESHPSFAYLPETLGAAVGDGEDAWGFLVREMTPRPLSLDTSKRTLVPLVSLYAPDRTPLPEGQQQPLLISLIQASGMDPVEFLMEKIIQPILKNWGDLFLSTGVLLEPHGQNLLLELDENRVPVRTVFRDFDTYYWKDLLLNHSALQDLNPVEGIENRETTPRPRGAVLSVIFDFNMAVALNQLAQTVENHFGSQLKHATVEEIQRRTRKFLDENLSTLKAYFPEGDSIYNYRTLESTAPENTAPQVERQPGKPVWRSP